MQLLWLISPYQFKKDTAIIVPAKNMGSACWKRKPWCKNVPQEFFCCIFLKSSPCQPTEASIDFRKGNRVVIWSLVSRLIYVLSMWHWTNHNLYHYAFLLIKSGLYHGCELSYWAVIDSGSALYVKYGFWTRRSEIYQNSTTI